MTLRWHIHFFERADGSVPATEFLDKAPTAVVAEFQAILDAVAEAPPPAFSGGGKWEVMHGEMGGFYEARVRYKAANYRLFCVLDRPGGDLGGPSIVVIAGLSKPRRNAARTQDYQRARVLRDEFRITRRVMS